MGIRHRLSQTLYVSDVFQPHAGTRHTANPISEYMSQQLWMPLIGQSSAQPAVGMTLTVMIRVDGRGGPEDDKKQKDGGGNKKRKKGGSSTKEGGSTASGGTKHGMAAKVCPI